MGKREHIFRRIVQNDSEFFGTNSGTVVCRF